MNSPTNPLARLASVFGLFLVATTGCQPASSSNQQAQNQIESCEGAALDAGGYCRTPRGRFAAASCCEAAACLFDDGLEETLEAQYTTIGSRVTVEATTELSEIEQRQIHRAASDALGPINGWLDVFATASQVEFVSLAETDGWRNYRLVSLVTENETYATIFGTGSSVPVASGNRSSYAYCDASSQDAWSCLDLEDDVFERCLPDDDSAVDWSWCLGSTLHGDATALAAQCCEADANHLWCEPRPWTCGELEDYAMDVCLPDDDGPVDWDGCFARTPGGDQGGLASRCCEVDEGEENYLWCTPQ
ncbi:MAG: hypothetical protein AAGA56_18975 [Myxococcota bacterium]